MFKRKYLFFIAVSMPVLFYVNCGKMEQGVVDKSFNSVGEQRPDNRDPEPVPEPPPKETSYEPVLADRIYLKSLLEDVFGPTAMAVDTNNVDQNAAEFGSSCSIYGDYNIFENGQWVRADVSEVCGNSSAAYVSAPRNPKVTVTRQALLSKTCSDLISRNDTMTFALKRIDSARAVPQKNKNNVIKAYHLFYRDKPAPDQPLIDSLMVMLPDSGVNANHWRVVLNAVCLSNYWQVL